MTEDELRDKLDRLRVLAILTWYCVDGQKELADAITAEIIAAFNTPVP